MAEWILELEDLKQYPHFDWPISKKEIIALVSNVERVQRNSFYPFLKYEEVWQPFRKKGAKPPPKNRPIRYAARRDAYIFSYYRHLLSIPYEAELSRLGISHCPIAYRRIPIDNGNGSGKCNIQFAHDAINEIDKIGDCVAVTLDISSYFENIDHDRLYKLWCNMLGVDDLPVDHQVVFNAITKYRFVDQDELYSRLGFIVDETNSYGAVIKSYTDKFRARQKKICTNLEFRDLVCGDGPSKLETIIKKNTKPQGIPQGAPISDLLANLYLLHFDEELHKYAVDRGGYYSRYSDDILLILPGGLPEGASASEYTRGLVTEFGANLLIKEEKCQIVSFIPDGDRLSYEESKTSKNGFEYLGFRYDGKSIFLRDSTLSRFYRKLTTNATREAILFQQRNPSMTVGELIENYNMKSFLKHFGRVSDFDSSDGVKNWTFWTYVKRSADEFDNRGSAIYKQVSGYKKYAKSIMAKKLLDAFNRANK